MKKVFKQQKKIKTIGLLNKIKFNTIHHNICKPSKYKDENQVYTSSCLGCQFPQCIKFKQEELNINDERLNNFPIDKLDSVCPIGAIIWENNDLTPSIIPELCINCGLCARRCPIGAIYSNGSYSIIHTGEKEIIFKDIDKNSENIHKKQLKLLSNCTHTGKYLEPSVSFIDELYKKIYTSNTDYQFPNLFIRNLFIVLGNKCIIHRKGDIYFRIDAIIEDKPVIGIAEIEFKKDSLESPRAILEDIAVLSSRCGVDKFSIKPFIVSLEFPNIRTEYWRVIKDINEVLNIRIYSLTLGALCVINWNFSKIPIGTADFYADIDTPSIKDVVKKICSLDDLDKEYNYAIFEPKK